jgi:hypothetical protein
MINSKEIQEFIMKHWYEKHHCPYVCSNFSGCGFEEMDVVAISRALIITEFEIKMSRSDFFADFKKVNKHLRYSGKLVEASPDPQTVLFYNTVRPNKFYYCCPNNLIKAEEVPLYAGLIYFTKFELQGHNQPYVEFKIIKKAPFIHHEKCGTNVLARIAQTLSARFIFGCALMTYQNRRRKEQYADQRS